jgi:hypothetical protein
MQLERRFSAWLTASTVAALACASAGNETAEAPEPYAALAPLIGEWNVGPAGASTAFVERFSWGPNRAYIQFSVTLIVASGEEHLHMDGMVIWNAATRRFDYLLAVEPGSLAQEQGEFYRNDKGDIIRDVILTGADGATGQFRQTFRAMNDGRFGISLLRRTAGGWTPTFPGSDQLIMARRAG